MNTSALSESAYVLVCVSASVTLLSAVSEYNVAVFITNQMTADPGATMT